MSGVNFPKIYERLTRLYSWLLRVNVTSYFLKLKIFTNRIKFCVFSCARCSFTGVNIHSMLSVACYLKICRIHTHCNKGLSEQHQILLKLYGTCHVISPGCRSDWGRGGAGEKGVSRFILKRAIEGGIKKSKMNAWISEVFKALSQGLIITEENLIYGSNFDEFSKN